MKYCFGIGDDKKENSLHRIDRRQLLAGLGACSVYLSVPHLAQAAERTAASKESYMSQGELQQWRSQSNLHRLEAAFRFLEQANLDRLPLGKHAIDGDKVYALVSKAASQPVELGKFEVHRKYIDVHYIIAGQEIIGFAPIDQLKVVIQPYSDETDAELFPIPKNYLELELSAGKFAVFFPGGGHMPGRNWHGPHEVHKVVVKVQRDYGTK